MSKTISIESFFRNPEKTSAQVSPDGNFISWLAPWENRLNVHVQNIQTNEINRVSSATERNIYGYAWISDTRIVYIMDNGGDENTHLYGVSADGSNPVNFTPFDGVKCNIVDMLHDDPEHVLIQMNQRDPRFFDVYLLNTDTGKLTLTAENPGEITRWIADHDGKVRMAESTDGVNSAIYYRHDENSEWKVSATYNFKEKAMPLIFSFDNKKAYVASNVGRDKRAIFEYDLENGKETTLVFEHPEVDVDDLTTSKKRKVMTAVYYYTDKKGIHFLDKRRQEVQEYIENNLQGRENTVTCFDDDEVKAIVYSGSDRSRGSYYLLDMSGEWKLTKLFDTAPWLKEEDMAHMKPVKYKARDGVVINGYLTLPKDKEAKNLPVIIHPHGGPWARDYWGFNPEIQFLANRGYAVLQMNFRGSDGYGREFLELSFKQWGLTMQDDITDGANWLIEQGIADPAKLVIYGASYGGYATLMGLVKTPELYAAAIDYVGVSNMFTFIETVPPYWEPMKEMIYEMVGHPENDKEQFIATSPALNAEKIVKPLFIAQGANDPRVKKSESDQMVEALKARGVEVEYMVKDNEGHGFHNEENRFDFYRAMENFLKQHL